MNLGKSIRFLLAALLVLWVFRTPKHHVLEEKMFVRKIFLSDSFYSNIFKILKKLFSKESISEKEF